MTIESQTAQVQTDSSLMELYVSRPSDGQTHPAVIVGFELFGLTAYVRKVTDAIARLGYVAVAPDFYHRSGQGIQLQADDAGRKRGFEALAETNRDLAMQDVAVVMQYLRKDRGTTDRTGFVGLSVGGHIGFAAAAHFSLQACIAFYPGWLTNTDISLSQPNPTIELSGKISKDCRVLILAGEHDKLLPPAVRNQITQTLQAAAVDHEFVVYSGTAHGFFCDERPETYNAAVSKDAWSRVRFVLHNRLQVP